MAIGHGWALVELRFLSWVADRSCVLNLLPNESSYGKPVNQQKRSGENDSKHRQQPMKQSKQPWLCVMKWTKSSTRQKRFWKGSPLNCRSCRSERDILLGFLIFEILFNWKVLHHCIKYANVYEDIQACTVGRHQKHLPKLGSLTLPYTHILSHTFAHILTCIHTQEYMYDVLMHLFSLCCKLTLYDMCSMLKQEQHQVTELQESLEDRDSIIARLTREVNKSEDLHGQVSIASHLTRFV